MLEKIILNLIKEQTKKLLYESYSTNVIIVDIQPAYDKWCKHLMPQLCDFLNKQRGNTLIFFNGEDLDLDNKNSVINYYYDYGLSEEKIETIEWKEKIYGYFRDLMDSDIEPKIIIKIIREMFLQKVNDSRDLPEDFLNLLYNTYSVDLENYPTFLPDFSFKLLKEYNNCYIGGGGKHECFREITLLMNALNIKYKEMKKFIY